MSGALSGQGSVDLWEKLIKENMEKHDGRPMCQKAIPGVDKPGGAIDTGMFQPQEPGHISLPDFLQQAIGQSFIKM